MNVRVGLREKKEGLGFARLFVRPVSRISLEFVLACGSQKSLLGSLFFPRFFFPLLVVPYLPEVLKDRLLILDNRLERITVSRSKLLEGRKGKLFSLPCQCLGDFKAKAQSEGADVIERSMCGLSLSEHEKVNVTRQFRLANVLASRTSHV